MSEYIILSIAFVTVCNHAVSREYDSRYDTTADLSVKCTARHCKVGIFIANH